MNRWAVSAIALLSCVVANTAINSAATDLQTYYEKSGFVETPRYDDTIDYARRLAESSEWIRYATFGESPQGRDLPLLIVDKHGNFEPTNNGKAVLLIQAGIHSGEIDGKDAGFMLLRDLVGHRKHAPLLDNVTILFVPIFNVDGHERFGPYNRINQNGPKEMGWRVTAQGLNLNRDFLKADAPEMRDWLRLYQKWKPDFLADCHVTNGTDHQYVVTYILETFGGMAPTVTDWTANVYVKKMKKAMADAGFDFVPYFFLKSNPDPMSGTKSWNAPPRFSNGYTALHNRPGIVVETHMMKDYKTRVTATYETLFQTVVLLNDEHKRLGDAIAAAEALSASRDFRSTPFPLRFEETEDRRLIDFKGWEYEQVESRITGGQWFKFSDKPNTFQIPYYDVQRATMTANLPDAYVISPEWIEVIDRLAMHGVALRRLSESTRIAISTYRFSNTTWETAPYEGRHRATFDVENIEDTREFPKGSVIVDMNQVASRVAAHILEPKAPDSFVHWGFFDVIFEQKEYAASYVIEEMAREMFERDPGLRDELETKKHEDPGFAENPNAILNWIYSKTPYWDARKDVYPVGKIFDAEILANLPVE